MGTVQNLRSTVQNLDPGARLGDVQALAQAIAYGQGLQTTNGVTASTTQTQAAGTQLQYGINVIGTSANAADAVKAPQALPGTILIIANNGGNTVTLFPTVGDTLNDAAQDAGIVVADNTVSIYVCGAAGQWFGGAITLET